MGCVFVFVKNFLMYLFANNCQNWMTPDLGITNRKGVQFFLGLNVAVFMKHCVDL